MNHKRGFFLTIYLLIFLSACSTGPNLSSQEKDSRFLALLDVKDVNQSIVITSNPISPGEVFFIKNQSSNFISFAPDFEMRIFYFDNLSQSWQEGENLVTLFNGPGDLLQPGGDLANMFSETIVPYRPSFGGRSLPDVIRVSVKGHVYKTGVRIGEAVAAYLDITLK